MTNLETLELLGNQLLNLADEIKEMFDNEDFESVFEKLEYKDELLNKFIIAKKTASLTDEQQRNISLLEIRLREKEESNLNFLKKLRDITGEELKNNRDKLKINSAYSVKTEENHGEMIDFIE